MVKRVHAQSAIARSSEITDTAAPPLEVPRLLTTSEAARVLGMKPQTLAIWRCKKRYPLRFVKMGGAVRYLMADLAKFLEASAVAPAGIGNPKLLRRSTPRHQAKHASSD
jgi:hypothetical protein